MVLGFLALGILAAFLFVVVVGAPGFLAESWLEGRLGKNVRVSCGRIRLLPLGGITVHDVAISAGEDLAWELCRAESLALSRGSTRHEEGLSRQVAVRVEKGVLYSPDGSALPLAYLAALIERRGDQFFVRHFEAIPDPEEGQGPVRGELNIDLGGETWAGSIDSACMPAVFIPLLPSNLVEIVSSIRFEAPPLASFRLAGVLGSPDATTLHGRVFAERLTRHGVDVDLIHATIHYENSVFRIEDIQAVREEGIFRGSMQHAFEIKEFAIKASSTTDPLATARIIRPSFEDWLQPYAPAASTDFEGEVRVGYATNKTLELHGHVEGEGRGFRAVVTDHGKCRVDVSAGRVDVSDIEAAWCGGTLTGRVLSDIDPEGSNRLVELELALNEAELPRLLSLRGGSFDADAYSGRVGGTLVLSADTRSFVESVQGHGTIRIRDCDLFSTRLGAGLARYLGKLHPALGPGAGQKLDVSYTVSGKTLRIEDLALGGRFSHIQGTGTCTLDGELRLRVQVKLLHEGLTARAVQLLTLPVTKLLEFECTGTVDQPVWRPINAPQNILRRYRGEEET